ncbi:hypothetical protein EJB05_27797, partial [Eragrostis curvula]
WIYYALIKSNECLLITINSAGCVIETIYIVVYLIYAPKKAKMFTAKIMLLLNVGVFGLILLLTLLLATGEKRIVLLGWVCVGFSVSVFVAPLSIIVRKPIHTHLRRCPDSLRKVRTRSVEFMPFSLSLSLTVSAVVWFLYGLFIKDKYVAPPNVIGFTFGVIQMVLYAFYRNATPVLPAKEVSDDKEVSVTAISKVPEHAVTISKLGTPGGEVKSCEVRPIQCIPTGEAKLQEDYSAEELGKVADSGSNAV